MSEQLPEAAAAPPGGTVRVRVPAPLRKLTNGSAEVHVSGVTLREVIDRLEAEYPGLKNRLCEDEGELRRFVNVFVGEEDVRFLSGLDTEVKSGQTVSIVPAIAGGSRGRVFSY